MTSHDASTPANGESIRLAFLLGQLRQGGAELQMIALTRGLVEEGFRVDLLCRAGAGPLDGSARAAGARVRTIGDASTPGTPLPKRLSRLAAKNVRWLRTARSEHYDIVDAWLHPADYVAALSRPITRTPVVMAARIDQLPRVRLGPATPLLRKAVHRATDVVVANADIAAQDAVRHGVPADKVRIIRGGVEMPRAFEAGERREVRASMGVTDDHFLIGCVGTFRPMKRQDLLIDAFSRLVAEQPRLRLVLVGDGDLRPHIEGQVDRLGLEGSVILFGTGTDMPPLYNAFDLFAQASNSEALPNVLLEASAASLPIVATAAGGSGEIIRDGETGLLVPIDDVDRLTAALRTALDDADLRRRLAGAARALVEREYGMDRFIREYRDLYHERLAASGRGERPRGR